MANDTPYVARGPVVGVAGVVAAVQVSAQQSPPTPPAPVEFEAVSIKLNPGSNSGGMQFLPDGSATFTNVSIDSFIRSAAPTGVREVVGLPEWARTERYDVIAKAPAGATRAQSGEMWRAFFAERMKLKAHVEEREQDTYALVLDRADGRLGPQLQKSALDCSPGAARPAAPPQQGPPTPDEMRNRCGISMSASTTVSGGAPISSLIPSIQGSAGRLVNDRTGLTGYYAFTLSYTRPEAFRRPDAPPPGVDEPPDLFTALREQLGLKLVPDKSMVPVFVIDHIERPTPN